MTIETQKDGGKMTLSVIGRLDTTTAPQLEETLGNVIDDVDDLTFDFEKVEYISSAGLRVLLSTQKKMPAPKKMAIANVNEVVMQVFEITGFNDILTLI